MPPQLHDAPESGSDAVPRDPTHGGVPPKKLLALMQGSDEMMQSIFRGNVDATMQTVVRCVHDLLDAEACTFFTVDEANHNQLVLRARYTDLLGEVVSDLEPRSLKIHNDVQGGFTGHVAFEGKWVRHHGTELDGCPFIAKRDAAPYLASGRCSSTLAGPLKDRKGSLVAVLKVRDIKSEVQQGLFV